MCWIWNLYNNFLLYFSESTTSMNKTHFSCIDCTNGTTLNNNLDTGTWQDGITAFIPLLSAKEFYWSIVTLSFVLIVTSCLGIILNILVLTAFLKIGFSESVNISFFALGLSDIGVLGTVLWGAILNILEFMEIDVPFHALQLSGPTMYYPGEGFEKTTSCITAYISLERCLCVLFPLHVKRFVTRRKTCVIVTMIFVLVFLPTNLGYLYQRFEVKFDPALNKTMLFASERKDPLFQKLVVVLTIYINSGVHFTALISIWICSIFLAVTLKRNAQTRESKFGQASTNVSQIRNQRVIKTVLLTAAAYIAFSTPKTIINIVTVILEDLIGTQRKYFRIFMISIVLGVQINLFNSSVNIFIYMFTSSSFRAIIKGLLS